VTILKIIDVEGVAQVQSTCPASSKPSTPPPISNVNIYLSLSNFPMNIEKFPGRVSYHTFFTLTSIKYFFIFKKIFVVPDGRCCPTRATSLALKRSFKNLG
jgi:hypothetical protein